MVFETTGIKVRRAGGAELLFEGFSLAQGEKLLLLGPSGSGKTTLLSVLAGFLVPSEGSVIFSGQDLYQLPSQARDTLRGQKIGFVFQTLHLLPSLSVTNNILLAAKMAGLPVDRERVHYLLHTLGISHKGDQMPSSLSQGEQQRVAIARAVFNKPAVILADEPTSALDDKNTNIIMDLLQEQAHETGASLLLATHDNRVSSRFQKHIGLKEKRAI